jgi:hypothetical protein
VNVAWTAAAQFFRGAVGKYVVIQGGRWRVSGYYIE